MLSLEIIGVLSGLFGFLVWGMVRTHLARQQAEADRGVQPAAEATR